MIRANAVEARFIRAHNVPFRTDPSLKRPQMGRLGKRLGDTNGNGSLCLRTMWKVPTYSHIQYSARVWENLLLLLRQVPRFLARQSLSHLRRANLGNADEIAEAA